MIAVKFDKTMLIERFKLARFYRQPILEIALVVSCSRCDSACTSITTSVVLLWL